MFEHNQDKQGPEPGYPRNYTLGAGAALGGILGGVPGVRTGLADAVVGMQKLSPKEPDTTGQTSKALSLLEEQIQINNVLINQLESKLKNVLRIDPTAPAGCVKGDESSSHTVPLVLFTNELSRRMTMQNYMLRDILERIET